MAVFRLRLGWNPCKIGPKTVLLLRSARFSTVFSTGVENSLEGLRKKGGFTGIPDPEGEEGKVSTKAPALTLSESGR